MNASKEESLGLYAPSKCLNEGDVKGSQNRVGTGGFCSPNFTSPWSDRRGFNPYSATLSRQQRMNTNLSFHHKVELLQIVLHDQVFLNGKVNKLDFIFGFLFSWSGLYRKKNVSDEEYSGWFLIVTYSLQVLILFGMFGKVFLQASFHQPL